MRRLNSMGLSPNETSGVYLPRERFIHAFGQQFGDVLAVIQRIKEERIGTCGNIP